MAGLTGENRLRIAWAVALAGTLAVIAAQFMDYTGFELVAGGPAGANEVAPPPVEFTERVGPDQLWAGLVLGLAGLVALRFAWGGMWRLGRSVAMIGAVMLILSFAVLLRNGTDGSTEVDGVPSDPALAYAGVEEKLLGGFWVQLAGSAAMAGAGIAMARLRA